MCRVCNVQCSHVSREDPMLYTLSVHLNMVSVHTFYSIEQLMRPLIQFSNSVSSQCVPLLLHIICKCFYFDNFSYMLIWFSVHM